MFVAPIVYALFRVVPVYGITLFVVAFGGADRARLWAESAITTSAHLTLCGWVDGELDSVIFHETAQEERGRKQFLGIELPLHRPICGRPVRADVLLKRDHLCGP